MKLYIALTLWELTNLSYRNITELTTRQFPLKSLPFITIIVDAETGVHAILTNSGVENNYEALPISI